MYFRVTVSILVIIRHYRLWLGSYIASLYGFHEWHLGCCQILSLALIFFLSAVVLITTYCFTIMYWAEKQHHYQPSDLHD